MLPSRVVVFPSAAVGSVAMALFGAICEGRSNQHHHAVVAQMDKQDLPSDFRRIKETDPGSCSNGTAQAYLFFRYPENYCARQMRNAG